MIVAIVAVAMLSILALGISSAAITQLKIADRLVESNLDSSLAMTTVDVFRKIFCEKSKDGGITLYELRDRVFKTQDKVIKISLSDEQSKINIDLSPKSVLSHLPGLSRDSILVDEIYDASLKNKADLLLVGGMTKKIYGRIKNMVTVYGTAGLNINTASGTALSALGMDERLVDIVRRYRSGSDGKEGTRDDRLISISKIFEDLERYGLTDSQKGQLVFLFANFILSDASQYVCADILITDSRQREKRYEIIFSVSGRIVSWVEE